MAAAAPGAGELTASGLSYYQVSRLKLAQDTEDYTQLLWLGLGVAAQCCVVKKRRGGMILALPDGAMDVETLAAAAESGYASHLGPSTVGFAPLVEEEEPAGGDADGLNVLLLEVASGARSYLQRLTVDEQPEDVDIIEFTTLAGEPCWPPAAGLRRALAAWLEAHGGLPRLEWYTADEGAASVGPGAGKAPGAARSPVEPPLTGDALSRRVLEELSGLATSVQTLAGRVDVLDASGAGQAAGGRATVPRAAGAAAAHPGASLLPKAPPGVAPGGSAGVQLLQPPQRAFAGGLGAGGLLPPPPPSGRLLDPGAGRGVGRAAAAEDLGDALDGEEFEDREVGLEGPDGQALLRRLLTQTSAAVAALSQRGGQNEDVQLLAGGTPGDGGSGPAGARGAAARELQRQRMVARPEEVTAVTRQLLQQQMGGEVGSRQDALAFFTRYGVFEPREAAYVAWILAHVWNLLELERVAAAQALVGTSLAAVDQWGRTGRLDVGYLWTHLPEPPWGLLQRPAAQSPLTPFSTLASPAWAAMAAAYLRDMEALEERLGRREGRRRRGPRVGEEEQTPKVPPKPGRQPKPPPA